MLFADVENIDAVDFSGREYSLGIFASGFENRSTYIAKILDHSDFAEMAVLGFPATEHEEPVRVANDCYFRENLTAGIHEMNGIDDEEYFYSLLDAALVKCKAPVFRVCVDYSVMTRSWYAAILNWARVTESARVIEVDFLYASGRYLDEFQSLQIQEIVSLPNFEGISTGFRQTTAIFCVGYDTYGTLAVYDRIEPDVTHCCVAGTQDDDAAVLKAVQLNAVLLESANSIVKLPLLDLVSSFRSLCNLVLTVERDSHVVIVPMGPKPHVLVTMLVALRMPWITCLYAKGSRRSVVQVDPAGPVSRCRVRFVSA